MQQLFRRGGLYLAISGSLAASVSGPLWAAQVTQPAVRSFSVAPGPLGQALNRFAEQAGLRLMVTSDLIAQRTSPGVNGSASTEQALARLLSGTGLVAQVQGDRLIVLPAPTEEHALTLDASPVVATAEEESKQMPGVSIITAQDIQKSPPVNDLSDIIRKMPGVNLTGNSATGVHGNNRQIDIRGMGPENTLILIDGKPVTSRNAIRYSVTGDRDTRGDTNWVPAEQVERIEVIRGPAAARYGNGASGGVINIVTKRPDDQTHGTLSLYTNMPTHHDEGATKRANFSLSGPLTDTLHYRLYGNVSTTDNDDFDINKNHQPAGSTKLPAGAEGVRNKDLNALLTWRLDDRQSLEFETSFSRQGNLYAGESQGNVDTSNKLAGNYLGRETNKMYRQTYAITHNGDWDFGTSKFFLQYENTRNRRLNEGLGGGAEGLINSDTFTTSELKNWLAHGEFNLPLATAIPQTMTLGGEWTRQELNDPASLSATTSTTNPLAGYAGVTRNSEVGATIGSLFAEDNIELAEGTMLTPGVRMDDHQDFGPNWSPSLNLSQRFWDDFTFKAGIARAFKAPNLYQLNPNYMLVSNGNGCSMGGTSGCYILGNAHLDPEISVNKELGIEFKRDGWVAGLTYFRNDYRNKITVDLTDSVASAGSYEVYQWANAKKAVTQGVEGTLQIPLADNLTWSNNATWMIESKNKDNGNPLSLIPKYTLNSMLDWQVTPKLSSQLSLTSYGRQKPPTNATTRSEATGGVNTQSLGSYSLVGVNLGYSLTEHIRLGAGVSNLFDKRLFRKGNASAAGAASYNQHGRAIYTSLTASF
ncbi:TonB-dependent siderophore receptor [Pseudomonas sp. S31]|uniref:FepA family TonB-dependent siderophore receptor n=1 Tax=Pseudomonas sp. S31 TaxID=1564473 RepID=UPI002E2E77AC|nr:FepA family TonB-dependent siderophore receptor [Pseudomonas sp. S31]MBK4998724.1 TonB-dependent siderophore receptor [Pseudomonas sp. S31]